MNKEAFYEESARKEVYDFWFDEKIRRIGLNKMKSLTEKCRRFYETWEAARQGLYMSERLTYEGTC